jgi:hypothetical protein
MRSACHHLRQFIKMKKKGRERMLYMAIITILVIIIILLLVRTYRQYETLKVHREYFRQQNLEIQPWMTVRTVIRHFNITEESLRRELRINNTVEIDRMTLQGICNKNHLNCSEAVNSLNNLRT